MLFLYGYQINAQRIYLCLDTCVYKSEGNIRDVSSVLTNTSKGAQLIFKVPHPKHRGAIEQLTLASIPIKIGIQEFASTPIQVETRSQKNGIIARKVFLAKSERVEGVWEWISLEKGKESARFYYKLKGRIVEGFFEY